MTTWLHIRVTDHGDIVLGQCEAPDLTTARAKLKPVVPVGITWRHLSRKPPLVYETVVSRVSYELGRPRPLPKGRCTSCGHRDAEKGSTQCPHCRHLHRLDVDMGRRRDRRAVRVCR